MSEEHGKVEVQYLLEDWFAVVSSDGTVTLHVDVCLLLCRNYTTVRYGVSLSVLPGALGPAHKVQETCLLESVYYYTDSCLAPIAW